ISPEKAGYTFLGWARTSDATTAQYQAGTVYTVSRNLTFYAVWKKTTAPSAVTNLTATAAGKERVKLTWKGSAGVEGYLIYGQKNGKYSYVGMTTQGTTFTDTKAIYSDYNYYWVFPYVKDSTGKMFPGSCTKYVFAKGICPAAANLKAASVKGGVKLTWDAVTGAEGYLVYGIVAGKSYAYVGMTTQGTSFTDKTASTTQFNYYWVYPYFKDSNGKMVVGQTGKYTYGRAL
ncbi:MAG: InlB B-repeat-containing protein, partial [Clostridiales bacterium]|nr:InlB B-repeat-containing protein [Clostridiales bacterium]